MTRPCFDRGDNSGQAGFGEHHAGGRFGDLGRGGNGNPDLRLAQRRRIVGAVAAHADGVPAVLIGLDELELVLRQDAGEDGVVFGMDRFGNRPGRTEGAVEADRPRHDGGRRGRIARHHHRAHAQRVQFFDESRRVRARRVAQRDESDQLHRLGRSGRDRQHAKALPLELFGYRFRGRRGLCERDHHGVGALHHALRRAARIHSAGLGHFRGRVERRESGQLRRIGGALAQGGRPDGVIDWVLPAIRAGQRRQRQNMRFVEIGHRANLRHAQSVLRQGACLVRAQDIHRRRFIHRGEPCRQDAELGEIARAQRRREGEGRGQRDRYRRQNRRENERNNFGDRHFEKSGVDREPHDEDAIERGQIADDAHDRLLLRADDMSGENEFGGLRPNLVRAPVAVTSATASPRRTSAPA